MALQRPKGGFWAGTPPWIILGVLVILAPLFVFLTLQTIQRRNELTTELLLEKGEALIRSFEAGARTGMMGMQWGGMQVQRLLVETARQSDIHYLMVTDETGRILAHSDIARIGETYGAGLGLAGIAASEKLNWRRLSPPGEDSPVFEVFRPFSPTRSARGHFMRRGPGGNGLRHPDAPSTDWCRLHLEGGDPAPGSRQIVFVGLDMGPIEAARQDDLRHTVLTAGILLLIGLTAMSLLFLAQAYRSTRTALSSVQAFTGHLIERMPVGLIAVDPDGQFTSFNQTAGRMIGVQIRDMLGKPAREHLPKVLLDVVDAVAETHQPMELEVALPAGQNGPLPCDVMGTLLRRDDGTPFGVLIILRDLSEIQHLKREVARSQRLASVGKLAAGVAHEIRNPLSSIKGFATWFKQRHHDDPADRKTADIMIQEVDRLNRVISQLLEFARPPALHREPTEIGALVLRSLETVRDQAERRRIRIETDLEPTDRPVNIDRDRIRQVLLNLYLNAMEAMEEQGMMRVSVKREEASGTLAIRIADTGKGIAEQDLQNIFDPYFTTKPSGTGLGLAIVHTIVEAHGGETLVQSSLGAGTTVTVRLPADAHEKGSPG
ncbi:Signal transduction histidine kinase [uncultured Desulfatiglans sp.]|uniref:histidine kinase n=1 Tax=Uncultured Desulfatiglans sp. TaxID=1748965 RepID=A0A653AGR0_UNCDX|nr:Signal transduction histidine kinase [uncultured Desulfatiglans sp.]